ncbi:MAG: HD-GYP domain-containing protein [Pseudomonadota bacterium]
MRKKIDARDVQLGMYIAELDRPWLETPFMFQGFELQSQDALAKLQEICKYVWIDTKQGIDFVPPARGAGAAYARMQELADEDVEIRKKVEALVAQSKNTRATRKPYEDKATFQEEIKVAREIQKEAKTTIDEALTEIKKGGKKIDLQLAGKVVTRMVESVLRNPDALVCLSQLKEVSEYTALHSIRSCILALAFGRHLVLGRDELQAVGMGGLMHDIGMARVPEEILNKQSALDPVEVQAMRKHVRWGIDILQESGSVPPGVSEMVLQHHERGDGSGYPDGRQGTTITPAGYMGAIIDVYDAITSDRTYNVALSAEDALKRMYEWRHRDFNGELVEEFIRCMGIFPIGSLVELSTGSVGVVITINRARRLKPQVALVLTASKTPYSQRTITDLLEHKDAMGQEIKIAKVLPTGSYGINPMDHIIQL